MDHTVMLTRLKQRNGGDLGPAHASATIGSKETVGGADWQDWVGICLFSPPSLNRSGWPERQQL